VELKPNQSALLLTTDEEGEVTVDVESSDLNGLTGQICQAIAKKLMHDEKFQAELMEILDDEKDEY
jgi:hypothetical protein